jgi:hypothetical protein
MIDLEKKSGDQDWADVRRLYLSVCSALWEDSVTFNLFNELSSNFG